MTVIENCKGGEFKKLINDGMVQLNRNFLYNKVTLYIKYIQQHGLIKCMRLSLRFLRKKNQLDDFFS